MRSNMHISIVAEKIFGIGGGAVTNSLLLSVVALLILLSLAVFIKRKASIIPGKLQSIFELFLEELLSLMDSVLGSRALSERYLPLIATIFLSIMLSNWLGLFPGVGSIGLLEGAEGFRPLLRAPAADLNFTIALAIISVLSVNILGVGAIGFIKHFHKYFNFSNPLHFFTG